MPVTRFLVRSPRAVGGLTVRLHHNDPQRVVVRFFDSAGTDITEDAQRKIERLFHREDYRRVAGRGDRRHPVPAAGARGVHRRAGGHRRRREAIAERRLQARGRLRVRRRPAMVMPNVLGKLGADVLAVNPYVSTAGMLALRPPRRQPSASPAWSRASGAHLGAVLDPDGERITLVDDEGHVLDHTEALLALRRPGVPTTCSATPSPCRSTSPMHADGDGQAATASRSGTTKMSTAALMAAATEPGRRLRRRRRGRLHPARLPAGLRRRRRRSLKMLDLLARSEPAAVRRGRHAARGPPGPRDGGHARGSRRAW